jgi:superfamily II DNA or RNA helicase
VLLCSLKAGGVGLDLVSANHVMLLDLWWNPFIEEQAIDRVHRIGQTKDVHVLRVVIDQSVEHRIVHLQKQREKDAEKILHDQEQQFKQELKGNKNGAADEKTNEKISSRLFQREDYRFLITGRGGPAASPVPHFPTPLPPAFHQQLYGSPLPQASFPAQFPQPRNPSLQFPSGQ